MFGMCFIFVFYCLVGLSPERTVRTRTKAFSLLRHILMENKFKVGDPSLNEVAQHVCECLAHDIDHIAYGEVIAAVASILYQIMPQGDELEKLKAAASERKAKLQATGEDHSVEIELYKFIHANCTHKTQKLQKHIHTILFCLNLFLLCVCLLVFFKLQGWRRSKVCKNRLWQLPKTTIRHLSRRHRQCRCQTSLLIKLAMPKTVRKYILQYLCNYVHINFLHGVLVVSTVILMQPDGFSVYHYH